MKMSWKLALKIKPIIIQEGTIKMPNIHAAFLPNQKKAAAPVPRLARQPRIRIWMSKNQKAIRKFTPIEGPPSKRRIRVDTEAEYCPAEVSPTTPKEMNWFA